MRWGFALVVCSAWYCVFAVRGEQVEVVMGVDGEVDGFSAKSDELQPKSTGNLQEGANLQESANLQQNVEMMTTLQQELTAVEGMVKLQEKKLQLLEAMRKVSLQNLQQDEVQFRKVDVAQMLERRMDAAIAESVAEFHAFDEFFVERAAVQLQKRVVDVQMVKIRASAKELVAVAYFDGFVDFCTSSGDELLTVKTERKGIKSISLAFQDDQPCLIVTFTTPMIALYALNLAETDKTGKTTLSGPQYVLSIGEQHTVQMAAMPTTVAIARSSRQIVVAVAQIDGIIDFLALNGTSLRQMQTKSVITAMETRRNLLAFSNGTDIVVLFMTRAQDSVFHSCSGSSAGVSSIAFDADHHDIMYAGTFRGEILVYSVNTGSAEGQGCRLLSRSTITKKPQEFTPINLATTRKYVVAAGPRDITVFNVSISPKQHGVSLSQVCTNRVDSQSKDGAPLVAMAFSEGVMGSNLAFVTANTDGLSKLVLLHSLLPNEREVSDSQWTTFLYTGTVIVAVIGSQLFIRWQRQSSVNPWDSIGKTHDRSYGKYGGQKGNEHVSGFDGEDFGRYNSLSDDLREKVAQAKRGTTHRPIDDEGDY